MVLKSTCHKVLCLCLLITALVLYLWESRYVDTSNQTRQEQQQKQMIQTPPAALIPPGRNLMSKQPLQEQTRGPNQSKSLLTGVEASALLWRATEKLQCYNKKKSFQSDQDVFHDLVELSSAGRSGYILVASFREQQTRASESLFGLQCWARGFYVNIVEPYVENSRLMMPLNSSQHALLRYRDVFDLGLWQLLSVQHDFAPLASWEDFLAKAPRRLIVVRFKYLTNTTIMHRNENDSIVHMAVDDAFKEGCRSASKELLKKISFLTERHNFTVVRNVCINFAHGDKLTLYQFNKHIYGEMEPELASVLIDEWRGFTSRVENGKRVVLSDACPLSSAVNSQPYAWPSRQLICDARKYRQKYLLQNIEYIAVMLRTEKILKINNSMEFMAHYLNMTVSEWRTMKTKYGIQRTYLTMDIGKFGSASLLERRDERLTPFMPLYEAFVKTVLGPQTTIGKWETEFESVASHNDSGYIGSLQKTVAAQGKCMVLAGGGSFQKHARYMYERVVSSKRKRCLVTLSGNN